MTTPKRILAGETKADAIRRLWNDSALQREEIAAALGVCIKYVRSTIAHDHMPGYKTEWMRAKRADPDYRAKELARQREKYRQDNPGARTYVKKRTLEPRA